jgi:hypothetical protein
MTCKTVVRVLKKTQRISMTTAGYVTMLREIIGIYSGNHTKHINTLWAKLRVAEY